MKVRSDAHPALHDLEPSVGAFLAELLRGLSQRPKSIAAKFFYDEMGCQLFDEICSLDEYYLTRTEMGILREKVAEICALFGPECRLVEFGSGSNAKTRILLDHLHAPAAYVPVDIASGTFITMLGQTCTRLSGTLHHTSMCRLYYSIYVAGNALPGATDGCFFSRFNDWQPRAG